MQRMNNLWQFGTGNVQPGLMGNMTMSSQLGQITPAQILLLQQQFQQQKQQQTNCQDFISLQQQYLHNSRVIPNIQRAQSQVSNPTNNQIPFTSTFSVNSLLNQFANNSDKLHAEKQQQQQQQQQQNQIAAAVLGQHLVAAVANYRLQLNNKNQIKTNNSDSAFQAPTQKRQKMNETNENFTDFNSANTLNSSICSISSPSSASSSSVSFEYSNPELTNNSGNSDYLTRSCINNQNNYIHSFNESIGEINQNELSENNNQEFLSPESLNSSECKKRKKNSNKKQSLIDLQNPSCPVCGISLRISELKSHLEAEIERLGTIDDLGKNYAAVKSENSKRKRSLSGGEKSADNNKNDSWINHERHLTYLKIKENREQRMKKKEKLILRSNENKRTTSSSNLCELCNDSINESHLENCSNLKNTHNQDFDTNKQITGLDFPLISESNHKEIYSRRKRFKTVKVESQTEEYERDSSQGKCQFDDEASNGSSHKEIINGDEIKPTDTSNSVDTYLSCSVKNEESEFSFEECQKNTDDQSKSIETSKLNVKCQICSGCYQNAMISVKCWHVHCKICWFKTLTNGKLCPQCNTKTSQSDLRKIFL